ncbi:hypothetical protein CIHG_08636 [Coccidioides immitis H538.4]|uniref:Uncharacterized protein n=1 Tax=Coccidioides immitis H538.4 TaxID=396776 RepID=A0A0J8S0Z4_COCIT|nr:hypothetical protein CIHG_08636 [Coccidioides immitis H538.4]
MVVNGQVSWYSTLHSQPQCPRSFPPTSLLDSGRTEYRGTRYAWTYMRVEATAQEGCTGTYISTSVVSRSDNTGLGIRHPNESTVIRCPASRSGSLVKLVHSPP